MRSQNYLHYLPAFEAVARLGSVRRAAGELNLSPSAVSLQIKKLGDATGIALFEKSGRNVVLTRAGRQFSEAVGMALGQLDSAARFSRRPDVGALPPSLVVSLPTALGVAWLSSTIIAFAESHKIPHLTIHEALAAGDVDWKATDLAIVYDNPPFPGRHWQLLSEVRLRTVCSPVLFPRLDLQHRSRLNGVTLIHEDKGEEWAKWALAARISLHGSTHVRVESVAQAIASAVQGHGIALVSNVLTQNLLNQGHLIQPFATSTNAARGYYILCSPERADDPLLQSLTEKILARLHPARL